MEGFPRVDIRSTLDSLASLDRQIKQCKIDIMSNVVDNVERMHLKSMLENLEQKQQKLLKQIINYTDLNVWIRFNIYKQYTTGYCYSGIGALSSYKHLSNALKHMLSQKIQSIRDSGEIESRLYITLSDIERYIVAEIRLAMNPLEERKYELAIEEAMQCNFESLLTTL